MKHPPSAMSSERLRFDVALYTLAEAARIIDVPDSTLRSWTKGYLRHRTTGPDVVGDPVVTHLGATASREPSIPFIGLAEAFVLAAFRRSGVPMQRIRPALARLEQEIGLEHALASSQLYTDGAEVLYDFAEKSPDDDGARAVMDLVVARSGQRVFRELVAEYLQRIEYADDGYAALIRVPAYTKASVVVDPTRSFGAPIVASGGARVEDVLARFWSGDSIEALSLEFGLPPAEAEDIVRAASRRAA